MYWATASANDRVKLIGAGLVHNAEITFMAMELLRFAVVRRNLACLSRPKSNAISVIVFVRLVSKRRCPVDADITKVNKKK